jgi:hypothetical protein
MTVKELKENLEYYDDDAEIEFTLNQEVEVDSWTENKYGNKSVEVDLKLEPCFIGGTGNCWIDLEVSRE